MDSLFSEKEKKYQEKEKSLNDIFMNINTKEERNRKIKYAFYHGYKQSEISRYLEISSSSVSKIIKEA